ncbi:MAG: N-acyl homoserine lactonase family protein [Myxococcota bacterium]|jgi:glyoxylase-like metal-dependent hydrolase (beta-lactamase superfamily II)|nr:N-acyl homoserine lactonase family protein [Myxococcota bacterium]
MHRPGLAAAFASLFLFAAAARAGDRFEKVWCLQYATAPNAPISMLLAGAPADARMDVPFAMCVAKSDQHVVVLDAGYVNPELGKGFGATGWTEYAALLAEIGLRPEQVDFVTISHMHFDHAGGTSRFPKAKFIVQRRELEYAAGALPHNSAAKNAFVAEDVLALVRLNWQDRVLLADGDVEGIVPGVDVYLTPGHTAGTMTVCLDTKKGRVCYSSDAVYTYRNIEEDIPLGLALNAGEAVESFKKIRRVLRGGLLIPGHEPRIFSEPKSLGFRRVSDHAVAIVE